MTNWTKVKFFGALGAVAVIGGLAAFSFVKGEGGATIYAPAVGPLTVQLDGKVSTLPAGGHRRLQLPQGDHELVLTEHSGVVTKRTLHVANGGFDNVIPTSTQCFAELDVTEAVYTKVSIVQKMTAANVEVMARHADHQPFEVPAAYLALDELPASIESGHRAHVLLALPCAAFTDDNAIITAASI